MSKNAFTLRAHTQPRKQAAALVVERQPLACLQQTEQPFRELYSNHTAQLLGHEVACSPQSSRRTAESDRPLKWCVRPPSLSGCQQYHVWTVSSLYAATQEEDFFMRQQDRQTAGQRQREREKGRERCVLCQPSSPLFCWSASFKVSLWGGKNHTHTLFTVSEHLLEICQNKFYYYCTSTAGLKLY